MSQPWKKPKQSRISRFMSEFQHSPKRGGSLLVETGFPASLIDLFFKNRDRLKKPSNTKRDRLKRQIQTAPNALLPVSPNVISEKPTAAVQSKIEEVNFAAVETNLNIDCVCGRGTAFVFLAFKILIVMLIALSTKKKLTVTVGITLCAFALLLTELVAARLLTRFKLCKTDKNEISCETEKPSLKQQVLTVRDLLLKDEKSTSKSSRLKSKIVKKLRSYKKKKETIPKTKEEECLSEVSSLVSEDKPEMIEEEVLHPPLMGSKGDQTNGIGVLIVIVLVGLLSGKILAIGLTLCCLLLRFGLAKPN